MLAVAGLATANPVGEPIRIPLEFDKRAGKPTGGPASMSVTIYSGPATCASASTVPDSSTAGTVTTISLAENSCVITPFPAEGVFTAKLTAAPKTGTAGCYAQIFKEGGCGVTLCTFSSILQKQSLELVSDH